MAPFTGSPRALMLVVWLGVFNIASWMWAFMAFRADPLLLGSAMLAYGFGLRHALDADHIAAIDTVTRKLMVRGRAPQDVGLFFSLGHSTVVVLATAALGVTVPSHGAWFRHIHDLGGMVGSLISILFLMAMTAVNLVAAYGLWRAHVRRCGDPDPTLAAGETCLAEHHGLLARLARPLLRLVNRSWQMYPIGFLFGLGFDTATEIGLLGLAAREARKGLGLASVFIFPLLFTAGMALVDLIDGVLMSRAYGWASYSPRRRIAYNLSITLLSALVSLSVGGTEALNLLGGGFALHGGFWDMISGLADHFEWLGAAIVVGFLVIWSATRLGERFNST